MILVRGQILRVNWIGERARFQIRERGAWCASLQRLDVDGSAKIAGLSKRFHRIKPCELHFIGVVKLSDHVMPDPRFIHHHRREPWASHEHREGPDSLVPAEK